MLKLIWNSEERDWISVLPLPKFNQKYEREEEKGGERKCWILAMWIPKFLCPILLLGCERCAWSAQSEKKKKTIWQTNCSNAIAEIGEKKIVTIVAMTLLKMGEKKSGPKSGESKKKKCYVHNIFIINHMWLVIISLNLNLTLRLFF